jgi:hypothetical protein
MGSAALGLWGNHITIIMEKTPEGIQTTLVLSIEEAEHLAAGLKRYIEAAKLVSVKETK